MTSAGEVVGVADDQRQVERGEVGAHPLVAARRVDGDDACRRPAARRAGPRPGRAGCAAARPTRAARLDVRGRPALVRRARRRDRPTCTTRPRTRCAGAAGRARARRRCAGSAVASSAITAASASARAASASLGDLGHADRVAHSGVDQPLLHRGAVRPVERLPDRLHRALGRRRSACARCRRRSRARGPTAPRRATTSVTRPMRSAVSARDPFVVARQRHAQRLAEADPAHEADRFERATPARSHVRVEEGGVVGADDDVGLVDEVEARPRCTCPAPRRPPASTPSATSG